MKTIMLSITILVLTGCAGSFQPMSTTDKAFQATATILTIMDMGQTMDSANNHPELSEDNPLIGDGASDEKIVGVIAAGIMAQWLISWALPPEPRRAFQIFMISVEGMAVRRNSKYGLSFSF